MGTGWLLNRKEYLLQIGAYQEEKVRGKPPKEMTGEQSKKGWMLD
jgi:hypothetical protein